MKRKVLTTKKLSLVCVCVYVCVCVCVCVNACVCRNERNQREYMSNKKKRKETNEK